MLQVAARGTGSMGSVNERFERGSTTGSIASAGGGFAPYGLNIRLADFGLARIFDKQACITGSLADVDAPTRHCVVAMFGYVFY